MGQYYAVDLDRGVWSRTHPSLNMDIYMYVDDPGVYFNAHGHPVSKELAEAAGFDTEELDKKHKIKVALEKAHKDVLSQFGEAETKVYAERNGFKVMDIGLGRFNVLGPEGELLNKSPIPKEQAELLLNHLAPKEADKAPAKK